MDGGDHIDRSMLNSFQNANGSSTDSSVERCRAAAGIGYREFVYLAREIFRGTFNTLQLKVYIFIKNSNNMMLSHKKNGYPTQILMASQGCSLRYRMAIHCRWHHLSISSNPIRHSDNVDGAPSTSIHPFIHVTSSATTGTYTCTYARAELHCLLPGT